MNKVFNIQVGSKHDLASVNENWAIVHACKTSHQARLGYTKPPKDQPHYISFRDKNHLYLNWVDEPTGKYFRVETFIEALDFIDEYIGEKDVFIHCDVGQSRSPTLAMVYLAKRTDFLEDDFDKAFAKFSKHYPAYNPSGIVKFTKLHWNKLK